MSLCCVLCHACGMHVDWGDTTKQIIMPNNVKLPTVTLNDALHDDRVRNHLESIEQGGSEGSLDSEGSVEGGSEEVAMSDAVYPWWQEYKR